MNTIEAIVFDFDGTLYDSSGVMELSFRLEHDFLQKHEGMTAEQAHNFLISNGILTEARSATECFLRNGINPEDWAEYRTKYFDVSCVDAATAVQTEIIEEFRKFGKLLLLSSNTLEVMQIIMQRIGMSSEIFDEVICSNHHRLTGKFSKAEAFREIINEYKNILSIGDRYHSDIEPAVRLGGAGILVNAPSSVLHILDDISKGIIKTDSTEYTYYPPGQLPLLPESACPRP